MYRWLLTGCFVLGLAACQTPFLTFSGGGLQGAVVEVDSFAFAKEYRLLMLEVRPAQPYSVLLRVVMRGDQLYIDAAKRRRWHKYLQEDSTVRIKLGEQIYPAQAVVEQDPAILQQFLPGRVIYRILPRKLSNQRQWRHE